MFHTYHIQLLHKFEWARYTTYKKTDIPHIEKTEVISKRGRGLGYTIHKEQNGII